MLIVLPGAHVMGSHTTRTDTGGKTFQYHPGPPILLSRTQLSDNLNNHIRFMDSLPRTFQLLKSNAISMAPIICDNLLGHYRFTLRPYNCCLCSIRSSIINHLNFSIVKTMCNIIPVQPGHKAFGCANQVHHRCKELIWGFVGSVAIIARALSAL